MQAQTVHDHSLRSIFVVLIAASLLFLGGASGYALRAVTAITTQANHVIYVPGPAPSPAEPGKVSRFSPQAQ